LFLLLLACIVVPGDQSLNVVAAYPAPPDTDPGDTDTDTDAPDTASTDTASTDTASTDTASTDTASTDTADPGFPATWCHTLVPLSSGDLQLIVVDMATGTWVEQARWSGFDPSFHTGGLATDGSTWIFAGYDGNGFRWYAVDAATGAVTAAADETYALSVGWSGTEWVAVNLRERELRSFNTFADLSADTPTTAVPAGWFTRLGVDGADVYGAWHSTNVIDVHDLLTGGQIRTISLEDWDTWVWGVSVAGGKLHLIDDGREYPDPRIASFDPVSGALLERVLLSTLSGRPSGLWCGTTPP
jgi:hypothetical protein